MLHLHVRRLPHFTITLCALHICSACAEATAADQSSKQAHCSQALAEGINAAQGQSLQGALEGGDFMRTL